MQNPRVVIAPCPPLQALTPPIITTTTTIAPLPSTNTTVVVETAPFSYQQTNGKNNGNNVPNRLFKVDPFQQIVDDHAKIVQSQQVGESKLTPITKSPSAIHGTANKETNLSSTSSTKKTKSDNVIERKETEEYISFDNVND